MPVTGVEDSDQRGKEIDDDGFDINWIKTYTSTDAVVEDNDPFAKDFEFAKSLSGVHPNKKRSITAFAKRRQQEILEKRHESADGKTRSKKIEDDIITGYNAFEVVLPPYNLDYLAKLYELSTPHKAAVDAKVSNIVGLGYDFIPTERIKLKMDGFDKEKTEKYQKKLTAWKIDLIESINDMHSEDTFKETLEKVWKDYETMGNGYLEIGRSETTGKVAYIGHLPAATVRVRRQRDGFVQIIANKAVFFRNFGKDDADPIGGDPNPNEVIHLKKYAPSSTFYGVPDIVAAKTAVAGNDFSAKFNLDYFENKAVPRHVIILKGATINPRLEKNILEFFETGLKGKNHRSLFVPLPASTNEKKVEFEIKPVEAGVQDASFNTYRKANLSEILMAHRVPVNKVGLPEGVSLAVARDADKTFKEQVCGPEQDTLEQKVNKVIKDIQADQVLFDFSLNELTLTDEDTQSKIDERRIKTGQETANEQRVRRGLPSHPKGDQLVDLNAKTNTAAAQAKDGNANRQRDAQRSAGATDSAGEGRNAKGEGRTTP
jgi:PBSX family phage portal protein